MAEVLDITEHKTAPAHVASTATKRKIRKAAKLRVEGNQWVVVAKAIKRTPLSAAHLPSEYPELWRIEYDKALERYRPKLEAAAMNTVGELLSDTVRKPVVGTDGRVDGYKLEPTPLSIRAQASGIALTHARQSKAQNINVQATVALLDTTALVELARSGTFASEEQVRLAELGTLPPADETIKEKTDDGLS